MKRNKGIYWMVMIAGWWTVMPAGAQKKDFAYDFYGFVRGEAYGNSRRNTEVVDGLFYLLPDNRLADAAGEDLNAAPAGSFYTLATRLGVRIKGPDIGRAASSAGIEADFGGTTNIHFVLRIRHAWTKLEWTGGSSVLLGQTWHPFFGDVAPQVLNLSTGAPFQPFNRSPQIQYQYAAKGWKFRATALYQLMYLSTGPVGKSESYQKDGVLPELCAGIDWGRGGFLAGAGAEMLSLKPRLQSQSLANGQTYRVNERITSFSFEAHARYARRSLYLAGKTLLTSNMNHTALPGGYGVSKVDFATGKQEYTPFRHSTTWVNLVYGERWQGGFFGGYTKNLGSTRPVVASHMIYGLGMDIDRLATASVHFSYNLPHWKAGVEYQASTAWYGDIDLSDGRVKNARDVTNHRIVALFMYYF